MLLALIRRISLKYYSFDVRDRYEDNTVKENDESLNKHLPTVLETLFKELKQENAPKF